MNNSEARLTEALRAMAAGWASGAPPETGAALMAEFRRHHGRRRMVRRSSLALAALVVIALPAVLLLSRKQAVSPGRVTPGMATTVPLPAAVKPPATAVLPPPASKHPAITTPKSERHPAALAASVPSSQGDDFVDLPTYDFATQNEELRIVRLQMPARNLRELGAPVSPAMDDRTVLADFVVGQDGTPYAVRLLRQNTR